MLYKEPEGLPLEKEEGLVCVQKLILPVFIGAFSQQPFWQGNMRVNTGVSNDTNEGLQIETRLFVCMLAL